MLLRGPVAVARSAPWWAYVSVACVGIFAPSVFAYVSETAPEGLDPLILLDKYGLQGVIMALLLLAYPHKKREMDETANLAKVGVELAKKTMEHLDRAERDRREMLDALTHRLDDLQDEVIENRNTIRDRREGS